MVKRLIDDVFDALDEQTVVVPATGTLDVVIPSLARSLGDTPFTNKGGRQKPRSQPCWRTTLFPRS